MRKWPVKLSVYVLKNRRTCSEGRKFDFIRWITGNNRYFLHGQYWCRKADIFMQHYSIHPKQRHCLASSPFIVWAWANSLWWQLHVAEFTEVKLIHYPPGAGLRCGVVKLHKDMAAQLEVVLICHINQVHKVNSCMWQSFSNRNEPIVLDMGTNMVKLPRCLQSWVSMCCGLSMVPVIPVILVMRYYTLCDVPFYG